MVTAEIDALVQLFPQKLPALCWREGEDADFASVPAQLVRLGYVRGYEVETKGTFALRGDILDIYPVNAENPVRVDFFGDTVERIKPYDLVTGERLGSVREITVLGRHRRVCRRTGRGKNCKGAERGAEKLQKRGGLRAREGNCRRDTFRPAGKSPPIFCR